MADERELEVQDEGVGEGVENSTAEPTAQSTDSRQPEKKVNLDEFEEFRKYRSETDRRMAEMERRYQQQLAQQQQELRNRQMAGMDDYQRLEFELNETRQREQYAYQRIQEIEANQQKLQVLSEISRAMGVPVDAMSEAQDYMDAIRLASSYKQQTEQQRAAQAEKAAAAKQQARQEKAERNRVDTGSGTVVPPNTLDQQFKGARTSKDLAKLYWGTPE